MLKKYTVAEKEHTKKFNAIYHPLAYHHYATCSTYTRPLCESNTQHTRHKNILLRNKRYLTRATSLDGFLQHAYSVWDPEKEKFLEFKDLISDLITKPIWDTSYTNELGPLAQGIHNIKGSNCIFFIPHTKVPKGRRVTYGRLVVDFCPMESDPNRMRLTVGGNLLYYEGNVYTEMTDIITIKMLLNSVLSTPTAKFLTLDIKNFYLDTPMKVFEYMKLKFDTIPKDILAKYNSDKVVHNGHVYLEIQKGMYGLKQAGVLADEHLEKLLRTNGYVKTTHTSGLWKYITRPIMFTLCVDDFGIKYSGEHSANHLIATLKKYYEVITVDWTGKKICGINFEWDYQQRLCYISMKEYVTKALAKFNT